MTESDGLIEGFGRLPELVHAAVDGLTPEQLCWAPAAGANPIGWLVWHLTRVQDHHVAQLRGADQVWMSGDWAAGVGLTADPDNTGYAHGTQDIVHVRPISPDVLTGYYEAVGARTVELIGGLAAVDFAAVVDDAWDPPVTMRARLVSVLSDDLQHAGQAAYVRGLLP
jgi:Protein of unknown function (DUF664)